MRKSNCLQNVSIISFLCVQRNVNVNDYVAAVFAIKQAFLFSPQHNRIIFGCCLLAFFTVFLCLQYGVRGN